MLRRFDSGTTSESFYLYYPWFFSTDIFEAVISGTPDEDASRNILDQLGAILTGTPLHIAIDGIVRLLAREDWNWKAVQDQVRPVLDLHLLRAKFSPGLHQLYLDLDGSTQMLPSAPRPEPGSDMALKQRLFTVYLRGHAKQAF